MSWYALFVKTGYESNIKKWLDHKFDHALLYSMIPKRKVPEKRQSEVIHAMKTLFPGYVFIQTTMNYSIYYQLKENPNIYQTLNYRNEKDKCIRIFSDPSLDADQRQLMEEAQFFKEIPSEEMLVLLKLINDSAVIDYSKVYFQESKVVVQTGPLKGMEKLIKKIDKHKQRAKVLMSMMGAEQLIDFGIEIVQSPMESNLAR